VRFGSTRGDRSLRESDLPIGRGRLTARQQDLVTAVTFLLPSVLVFGVFTHFGLLYNFYISLMNWRLGGTTSRWVGIENYRRLFASDALSLVLRNTAYYAATTVVGSLILGLALAFLLNRPLRGRGLVRTLLFAPYVTTLSAAAMLWLWLYEPRFGLINIVLDWAGIAGPDWMRSAQWAMPGLILMSVWRAAGYNMVIYLAGLQSIPEEIVEAATLDGASAWQLFWRITLPLLSPTTFFLIVTGIIASFKIFTAVAVMTQGGPLDSTQVFTYYIYQQGFMFFRAGYAAAVSTVFFVLLLLLTLAQLRLQRRWVHY
jgi:sn-glycerol 3-phosphate transport system permease protein